MKKILFVLITTLSISTYSQDVFVYNESGLTDYVIINIDSLPQDVLFNKTINWIKDNYKNPDKVINAEIENTKLRFTGIQQNALNYIYLGKNFHADVRYSIEIYFKDNKIKFDPISLEMYGPPNSSIDLTSNKWLYKKNGKLKSILESYPQDIEDVFNNLTASLNMFLLKQSGIIEDKKDNW